MIVPMKKITLLTLASERDPALDALRELGVMQIVGSGQPPENSVVWGENLRQRQKAAARLPNFTAEKPIPFAEAELLPAAERLLESFDQLSARRGELQKKQEQLAVWGDFDRAKLEELRRNGVEILLCQGTPAEFASAQRHPDVQACTVVSENRRQVNFVVIAMTKLDAAEFPALDLAESDDPAAIRRELADIQAQLNELTRQLAGLAAAREQLEKELADGQCKLEFLQAQEAMSAHDQINTLSGYVPEPELEKLRQAAREHGWGLLISTPDEHDEVPILIKRSKFSRLIQPLFDFLGIEPGYTEIDASPLVLIFFTIFYAIIVGDAGYGAIFLLGGLAALLKFGKNRAARLPLALLLILSCATIIWGVLSGNYFGLNYGGLECLRNPKLKDQSIQAFCFMLAVAQLSCGHVWKAIHDRNWKSAAANFGWTLVIWGNFFLSYQLLIDRDKFPPQLMYGLYGVGVFLLILTGVNWRNPVDIFQFPFSIINSFTDVLSYIRLFAVGMAGACIAASFNDMGGTVASASPWFIVFGVTIIFLGHLLNLALAVMSVLVHAVRLNTLEFSNHIGLTWSGQKFHPFKNHNEGK